MKKFFQSLFSGNKLVIGIPYGWFLLASGHSSADCDEN